MTPEQHRALLDAAVSIARTAGEAIIAVYDRGFTVARKADDSPVTAADAAAQQVIGPALRNLDPALPVISEEAAVPPWEERRGWSTYWLVDPLDGTREFIRRNDQFAVNIALVEDGRPVLGIVHAPVSGQTWYGGPGIGAFHRDGRGDTPLRTAPYSEPPLRVITGRGRPGPRTRALLERLPAHRRLACGASLKLCKIAQGEADLFPRFGPISEWDLAAPQAVVEAAGGIVASLQTLEPLRYNQRPSLTLHDVAAVGDPTVDWRTLLGTAEHEDSGR